MPGRLAAWRALNGTDQRRLLALACGLPVVELSLRCLGARRTASWLSRAIKPGAMHPPAAAERQQAERLAQLAAIAGRRGVLEARCLSQAMLVRAVLRQRGLDAVLQVGVRRDASQFDAHAWVELDGRTLAQMALQHLPLQPPARSPAALR
jgi:Transglutaminase-like superfamily